MDTPEQQVLHLGAQAEGGNQPEALRSQHQVQGQLEQFYTSKQALDAARYASEVTFQDTDDNVIKLKLNQEYGLDLYLKDQSADDGTSKAKFKMVLGNLTSLDFHDAAFYLQGTPCGTQVSSQRTIVPREDAMHRSQCSVLSPLGLSPSMQYDPSKRMTDVALIDGEWLLRYGQPPSADTHLESAHPYPLNAEEDHVLEVLGADSMVVWFDARTAMAYQKGLKKEKCAFIAFYAS